MPLHFVIGPWLLVSRDRRHGTGRTVQGLEIPWEPPESKGRARDSWAGGSRGGLSDRERIISNPFQGGDVKGKRSEHPPEPATELKLTPPPDGKKKPKKEKKQWSGTWIEDEKTMVDRASGGKKTVVHVKANLTEDVRSLEHIFEQHMDVEIQTVDGDQKAFAAIVSKGTKMNRKSPGSDVLTMTVEGTGKWGDFVGRNVLVSGRQKKVPIGEHHGEPR